MIGPEKGIDPKGHSQGPIVLILICRVASTNIRRDIIFC